MQTAQTLNLYNIANRYFKNEADAAAFVKEIEIAVNEKVEVKSEIFEKIVTKDIDVLRNETRLEFANLKQEMYKVFLTKEDKVDILKWVVAMWIAQMAAIIFIIIRK